MSEAPKRPLPGTTGRMAPFFEFARSGVLALQRCSACGRHRFPATEFCSSCLSADATWEPASGKGEIFSYVIVHHALDPYFAARVPYGVVDVKLAEGPHVTAALRGSELDRIRIGDPVVAEFEEAGEGVFLPVFRRE